MKLYNQSLKTSIGYLSFIYSKEYLYQISFGKSFKLNKYIEKEVNFTIKDSGNNIYTEEVLEYLDGRRKFFNIPIKLVGSKFSMRVWEELIKVKYGKLETYKDIALKVGGARYSRAVGMANGKNPIPIIVPCHRIIKSNGDLGGYSSGLDIKKKLLKIESNK